MPSKNGNEVNGANDTYVGGSCPRRSRLDRCIVASAVSDASGFSVEVEARKVALRTSTTIENCRRLAHARGGAPRSGGLEQADC